MLASLMLLDATSLETGLSLRLILAVIIPAALMLVFLLWLVIHSFRAKVTTGTGGLVGQRGRAHTPIAPEGAVFVRGELWRARSATSIDAGEPVRVTGLSGLTLDVEVDKDEPLAPPT